MRTGLPLSAVLRRCAGRSPRPFPGRGAPLGAERGFSLIEVIVATVIAALAVIGLAHTFGLGRTFIQRFEVARVALGEVQLRLETLATRPSSDPDLAPGYHGPLPFVVHGVTVGEEGWNVVWVDDPADGTGAADPDPHDLKRVTVTVTWTVGAVGDSLQLSRVFPAG